MPGSASHRKDGDLLLKCWFDRETSISDSISATVSGFPSAKRKLIAQGSCSSAILLSWSRAGAVGWGFWGCPGRLWTVLFCKAIHVVWFYAGCFQVSWLEKLVCYLIHKHPQQTKPSLVRGVPCLFITWVDKSYTGWASLRRGKGHRVNLSSFTSKPILIVPNSFKLFLKEWVLKKKTQTLPQKNKPTQTHKQ